MAEYHVGCGAFNIYAGVLNKKGDMWNRKSDVTDEACSAVAQYLLINDEYMKFDYKDKHYVLKVEEEHVAEKHVAEEQDGEE